MCVVALLRVQKWQFSFAVSDDRKYLEIEICFSPVRSYAIIVHRSVAVQILLFHCEFHKACHDI